MAYNTGYILLYFILLPVLFLATVIQLCYLFLIRRFPPAVADASAQPGPVSIIICAKNEQHNLAHFLPLVLEQDYPTELFEVIVVDDASTDNSGAVLASLGEKYPVLRVLRIDAHTERHLPGKKFALARGIELARHNRLLLTDADCRPASDQWLRKMTSAPAGIILGYGAYNTGPGLLNRFIRWETVHTCMQYCSYALAGQPYMGVGRNLSYTKELLQELPKHPAFTEHYASLPSGDDDLLVSALGHKKNIALCLAPKAHTISNPPGNWSAWRRQKTRHVSTGKYYNKNTRSLLGLYALSHGLYWLSGLLLAGLWLCGLLPCNGLILFLSALFLVRLSAYWLLAANWYRRLRETGLLLFYPAGDLAWALYNLLLAPFIFWRNRMKWK